MRTHAGRYVVLTALVAASFLGGVGLVQALAPAPAPAPAPELNAPAVVTAPSETTTAAPSTDALSAGFERAVAAVTPSVVAVVAERSEEQATVFGGNAEPFRDLFGDDFLRQFFGDQAPAPGRQLLRSLGSGVVASNEGYVLTNNHVVTQADKVTVLLDDGARLPARIVGTDPATDLAVIKVESGELQAAQLGDSDDVRVGQWVLAVGNPFQLMHTVTAGIVSAKGRSSVGLAEYEDFIQTDASINPGNSGGALADLDGRIVGINTAISSPSGGNVGIGFAIPINMARGIMDELIAKGSVERGYLALYPQDIDENLAAALDLDTTDGALVGDVTAGGPAEAAGIRSGDVITEFAGQQIKDSVGLRLAVADSEAGLPVPVTVLRDGRSLALELTPGVRPQPDQASGSFGAPSEPEPAGALGLEVRALTPQLRGRLDLGDVSGVLVARVAPGSAADIAGLTAGDVIRSVNRAAVADVRDFGGEIAKLDAGDSVAFRVRRGGIDLFIALRVPSR